MRPLSITEKHHQSVLQCHVYLKVHYQLTETEQGTSMTRGLPDATLGEVLVPRSPPLSDLSLRKRFVPAGTFSLMYFNSKKPVSDATLVRELEEMEVVVVKAQPAPPVLVRRSSLSLQQISEISLRVDLRIDVFDGQYVFCRLDPGRPLLTQGDTCESIIRKVVAKRALPPSRHYALKTVISGPPLAMNTRITETTGCRHSSDLRLLLVHSLAGDFCSTCSVPRAEEPFRLENGKTLCPACEALAARSASLITGRAVPCAPQAWRTRVFWWLASPTTRAALQPAASIASCPSRSALL